MKEPWVSDAAPAFGADLLQVVKFRAGAAFKVG